MNPKCLSTFKTGTSKLKHFRGAHSVITLVSHFLAGFLQMVQSCMHTDVRWMMSGAGRRCRELEVRQEIDWQGLNWSTMKDRTGLIKMDELFGKKRKTQSRLMESVQEREQRERERERASIQHCKGKGNSLDFNLTFSLLVMISQFWLILWWSNTVKQDGNWHT